MAPSCSIGNPERYQRMMIGAGFVVGGFILRSDPFVAVTMVTVGSAVTAAAALGH
jgi:uncharacterized membrane protein